MLACAITRALFISYKEWELSLSENWRGKRKGMAIPKQRKKQPQRSLHSRLWKRFLRFSSKRFLRLLLIIGFIAFIPPIFFHFRLRRFHQMQLQKCGWLDDPPLVCAHGGDSSKSVPNTMDAYRAALLSQVDCIEVDVSRSLDGVLFALHDRDLQRMSGNSTAKVGYFNMNEIKGLDAGFQFPQEFHNQKVPTVEDALTLISKSVRQVILDAKVGPPSYEKGLAADILSVVKETKCTNCLIWAKSDILGRDVIRLSQNVTVGYIVMRDPSTGARTNLLRMKRAGVIGVYYPLIDEKLVRISHGRGKKVYAWTVDDEDSMKKMLAERVDGIVTNQPSLLQRLMQTIKTECLEAGFSLP
ncbi:glycerophosphodiester phosphodiesterase GDPD4 isoform X1 [Magnolia sinica]|uniref:glycerophosphodiester phosphodiesterase GDPD4 isoform X1 n=1 Tax=Magnolia sinica TaxID=86752 RepID=UPI00265882A6|nr:glycerophosphodiester phosphodiesterase GDPD4 isoform X1 [Magnolia sinica]